MYRSIFIFESISKTKDAFKNCGDSFSGIASTSYMQKIRNMVMPIRVEACQKFDFSLQKSWLLCNTNRNSFPQKI